MSILQVKNLSASIQSKIIFENISFEIKQGSNYAPTGLMKRMGYGKNYKYAHDYKENFTEQEFLPDKIAGTSFYEPGKNPREEELRKFLRSLWKDKYKY